jgi:iodotyrosine deiodinase
MTSQHASKQLQFIELPEEQMHDRARRMATEMQRRRSVREFDSRPVPRAIIEDCLRVACAAPSGANQQPWRFVAVSDATLKQQIRLAAEAEEREFYARRATEKWLAALAPLGTDASKPFLEIAPWVIAVFSERFGFDADGQKQKHYYPDESVGIATGFLLAALHHAGLATLTHTPSPMKFLNEILGRPMDRERPFLLVVTGYPAPGCTVPDIERLAFQTVAQFR